MREWPYTDDMTGSALTQSLREFFEADSHGASAVYFFGSTARGTAGSDSDVDIGLLLASPPGPTLEAQPFEVADALERALGRPVDVVVLNAAPVDLRSASSETVCSCSRQTRLPACDSRWPPGTRHSTSSRFCGIPPAPEVGVTDAALLAKRLALVETCVTELRTMARPDAIPHDLREQRFVEHTLQIAIQAALDVASHVVSDRRLGEPRTNRELFDLLARHGWIPRPLADSLSRMVGFRNVLVHGYDDVNLRIVQDVVANHLGELLEFVEGIRRRVT